MAGPESQLFDCSNEHRAQFVFHETTLFDHLVRWVEYKVAVVSSVCNVNVVVPKQRLRGEG